MLEHFFNVEQFRWSVQFRTALNHPKAADTSGWGEQSAQIVNRRWRNRFPLVAITSIMATVSAMYGPVSFTSRLVYPQPDNVRPCILHVQAYISSPGQCTAQYPSRPGWYILTLIMYGLVSFMSRLVYPHPYNVRPCILHVQADISSTR